MSKRVSRRGLLQSAALTPAAAAQQHVHPQEAPKAQAAKAPAFFQPHEWRTLGVLCELIIPADDHSPGARAAGAPEYIDYLAGNNRRIARIFTGGLAWLDAKSRELHQAGFADASAAQQTALLERIAWRERVTPEYQPGAVFFDWARKMTIDAFYTSRIGHEDIGYKGGKGMTDFQVPAEALQQALTKIKL